MGRMKSKKNEEQSEKNIPSVAITVEEHGWLGAGFILEAQSGSKEQEATRFWYCIVHIVN